MGAAAAATVVVAAAVVAVAAAAAEAVTGSTLHVCGYLAPGRAAGGTVDRSGSGTNLIVRHTNTIITIC